MSSKPLQTEIERFSPVLVRGGGDLGSGVVHALARAGLAVAVFDLPRPTALRLGVSFARAALDGQVEIEGVAGWHVQDEEQLRSAFADGAVPVWTGDEDALRAMLAPRVLVEARLKGLSETQLALADAPLVIALGPGLTAGRDAHYVIETNRGPTLGAVLQSGEASAHTGVPGEVLGFTYKRILRSPRAGYIERVVEPGTFVTDGQIVARVGGAPVASALTGMVRGLKLSGIRVEAGRKIGDVDPRQDRALLGKISDKSRAIGRGVVSALQLAAAREQG